MKKFVLRGLFIFLLFNLMCFSNSIIYLRQRSELSIAPSKIDDLFSSEIAYNIYDGLVTFDENGFGIIPSLAISWETPDNGKTWIFQLRKGVKFSDGSPFSADDVVVAYSEGTSEVKNIIEKVISLSLYKVEIILKKPLLNFIERLANATFLIPSKKSFLSGEFKPIGTGPFKLIDYIKNKKIVLGKNKYYWGGEVKSEKIIVKMVEDSYRKMIEFRSGVGDIVRVESKDEESRLPLTEGLNIYEKKSLLLFSLIFNTRRPPFYDKEIRKAFAHLLNKRKLISYIFQDIASPISTFVPPFLKGFNSKIKDYKFSVKESKHLLGKKRITNLPFKCTLYFNNRNNDIQRLATGIAQLTANHGFKINLKKVPPEALGNIMIHRAFDLVIVGFVSAPEAGLYLSYFFNSTGRYNFSGYHNKEVDSLLEKASVSSPLIRYEIYRKVQEIIHNDIPVIPLFLLKSKVVTRSNVYGIKITPLRTILFKNVYKK